MLKKSARIHLNNKHARLLLLKIDIAMLLG